LYNCPWNNSAQILLSTALEMVPKISLSTY
jgi:hypothetical protein